MVELAVYALVVLESPLADFPFAVEALDGVAGRVAVLVELHFAQVLRVLLVEVPAHLEFVSLCDVAARRRALEAVSTSPSVLGGRSLHVVFPHDPLEG